MRGAWVSLLLLLFVLPAGAEEPERVILPNGLRVIAKSDLGTDIVAIVLMLDVSCGDEPEGKAGIRYLTQRLLLRGSVGEPGESMGRRLSSVGGTADISVGLDYVETYALVPADGFRVAFDLIAQMVRSPAFAPEEVEKQRRAAIETVRAGEQDPFQESYLTLRKELYGGHPYARSVFGDARSLATITRSDLISFHGAHYRPGRAVVAVCGGVSPGRVIRAAEQALGDWVEGCSTASRRPGTPQPLSSPRVIARELPGRRARLMLGFPAPGVGAAGYYELQLIDSLLSGRANSRLPKRLREELGLVYDLTTFYPTLAGCSHMVVYAVTEPDTVEEVRAEIISALDRLVKEPVSSEEVARAKRFLVGSYALAHQRVQDQAYSLAWYEILGLGPGFERRYLEAIQAITPAELQETARSLLGQTGAGGGVGGSGFVLIVTMPTD